MSGQEITVKLTKRTIEGKAVRGLRRDGIVPAVIHDHGKESIIVMGSFSDLNKAYLSAGKNQPISVDVEGKKYVTLIKDVDFEPRKHTIRHIVFNAIKADEKQQTEITIEYVGDSEAEKAGLEVVHNLDTVEIEALPKDLIDKLEIDISSLAEVGDKLTVADLKAPSGVTILTDAEHPIATVEELTEQEVDDPDAETETEVTDGESTEGNSADTAESGEEAKSE